MTRPDPKSDKPFIIITSNVERQLPDPFLRRCIFYHIRFPERERLREIIVSRQCDKKAPAYIDRALDLFLALREIDDLVKKPATSELLNWVDALEKVHDSKDQDTVETLGVLASNKERVDWSALPGLCCLIKLREDRNNLGLDVG